MPIFRTKNWLSFLVACLVFGTPTIVSAQRVEFGIKAGVPITNIVEMNLGGFDAQTKRYTIGPVMDIHFPKSFSVEVSAMYKRFDQQGQGVTITGYTPCVEEDGSPFLCSTLKYPSTSRIGHSWEFPIAVQYHFPLESIRPYVEGGISFNNLSDVLGPRGVPFGPQPGQPPVGTRVEPTVNSLSRTGFLVGGGVDIKLPFGHLTPGVRFTQYGQESYPVLSSTNAVDIAVKFTFLKF